MFEINLIESGFIMADGGAMFGTVPKRSWEKKYPSTENNLCPLAMRCLLAVSHNKVVLADLGIGNIHSKQVEYYQPHHLIHISDSLTDLGYRLDDVTDVILTHLHFDHCGFATMLNTAGKSYPTFRNAKYWVSQKQWSNLLNPNPLEKDALFADNIVVLNENGLLHLVDNDIELCHGLRLKQYDGHSEGQLVALFDTTDGIIAFPGDLISTSAHVSLDWISAYDINALSAYTEKKRFLNEAVEKDYTLIYYHDAFVKSSKVKRLNENFKAFDFKKTNYNLRASLNFNEML